ncbi:MAG: acyclic terpene utilization AtuA family protein [Actinomycetota bacterium]
MSVPEPRPVRVANCSGFYGDRLSAAREQVEGGPIDVLTGDWLAELTMLILASTRSSGRGGGWARTFVTQMEQVMGTCLDRGIRVVANAGGLDPAGCAEAVHDVAERLGLSPSIAHVEGDDLLGRLPDLVAAGHELRNLDTGEPLGDRIDSIVTANAYLGGWGITEALAGGADIVVTGRVTDAAVVSGPAAWWHDWQRTDHDRLAGAIVAGHVIECGAQATGGNYSFFTEIDDLTHPGFPIAEIADDGSSVITKHEGTGGAVTTETVTAQLLYEIGEPAYANPDVVARFDTIRLAPEGPDRVSISGVRGDGPPPSAKVAMNYQGGFRNSVTFCLTGLDIEAKAELAERGLWSMVPGGRESIESVHTRLIRSDHADPATNEEAVAMLTITVQDPDERTVGRGFANAATQIALASYPGMFGTSPPGPGRPYWVYWPTLVPAELVPQTVVHLGGGRSVVDPVEPPEAPPIEVPGPALAAVPGGPTVRVPLGRVVGARSGDKGGNANLGVWARSDEAFAWLDDFLTVERLAELFPEAREHEVVRHRLPGIRSLNFVLVGLLGEGVAASPRQDGQAKGLGEYLRARVVDVPAQLVPIEHRPDDS